MNEQLNQASVTGGGGGYHRSRERTRQSAVQRLVERKLAQKEKEKEKERDSWASQYKNTSARSDYYYRCGQISSLSFLVLIFINPFLFLILCQIYFMMG